MKTLFTIAIALTLITGSTSGQEFRHYTLAEKVDSYFRTSLYINQVTVTRNSIDLSFYFYVSEYITYPIMVRSVLADGQSVSLISGIIVGTSYRLEAGEKLPFVITLNRPVENLEMKLNIENYEAVETIGFSGHSSAYPYFDLKERVASADKYFEELDQIKLIRNLSSDRITKLRAEFFIHPIQYSPSFLLKLDSVSKLLTNVPFLGGNKYLIDLLKEKADSFYINPKCFSPTRLEELDFISESVLSAPFLVGNSFLANKLKEVL